MATSIPLPYSPRRIVIGAAGSAAIAARILARRRDLDLRPLDFARVTDRDLADAEVYVGFKRPPNVRLMGSVRWVHSTGAGIDPWLAAPGLDERILLTRTPESFGPMIAEWAVTRVLAFQQQLRALDMAQLEARWAPRDIARLAGTRALVLGTGDIGSAIATALAALGVHVIGVSRTGERSVPAFNAVHRVESLPKLVGDAHWLLVTLPDTPATRGLVSRDLLSKCRGAVLLNAGRGAVVEEGAIPEAIERGWLRGAALDVFQQEPLPSSSPLWREPKVIVSPHISGLTTIEGAADGFLECLAELEAGRLPRWAVDRTRGY
jgi:phosphoglycerate dehydrogenase-like enzyme